MSLVSELSRKPEPPAYAAILQQFPAPAIAEHVGVTYGYIINILTGTRRPGKALEQKLTQLAAQVASEQAQ